MTEQGGEALYQVAVRALCEFSAKRGDLDLRFTPSPSALEGIAGHTLVTSRRPAHYQREVALDGRYRHLQVRGRADGYDPQANCLEEIKTHRGDLALQPANHRHLHWAQARVYGWLLCAERKLEEVELALVYLEVGSQRRPASSSGCGLTSCGCSSRASARRFSPGPSRNWRTASGATANWPRYAFPTPNSATASGNWRRRCTRPPPPVVA